MTQDGKYTEIGKSLPRVDGKAKVTGAAKYAGDYYFPRELWAQVVRSPYPHAKIKKIDTSAAEKLKGVRNVITGDYYKKRGGLYLADKNFLAYQTVKYRGEAVVAVCAETREIAEEACRLVKIDYEELPAVFSPMEAMKKGAPLIHPDLHTYRVAPIFHPVPHTNISHHHVLRKGDVKKGFRESYRIFEHSYHIPHVQHVPIETHVTTALYDTAGSLTVWSCCQSPYAVRAALADSFDIPLNKLRVISEFVGAGFGSKAGTTIEGIVIPLAQLNPGRHIRLDYSREDEFENAYVRQGMYARIKTGVDKKGKILAVENEFLWDGGAYTEYGVNIVKAAGFAGAGPYNIDNIATDSYCLYTNHPVGGPYRGFGMCEIHFAIEQNIDMIAKEMGISPVEMRKINGLRPGDTTNTGEVMNVSGYQDCLDTVIKALDYNRKSAQPKDKHKIRAKGIAAGWKSPSQPTDAASAAIIRMNEDGTFYLQTSAEEIGQGSNTVLTQIAAEVLNVNPDRITLTSGDTTANPYEWQTVASRMTYCAGNAVKLAAEDLKEHVLDLAQIKLGCAKRDIHLERDDDHHMTWVVATNHPENRVPISTFALGLTLPDGSGIGGPAIGTGRFVLPNNFAYNMEDSQSPKPVAFWTIGVTGAEVEVDTQTGHIKVLQMISCFDPGKTVNRALYDAQVEGGMIQAMGTAIFEELMLKDGRVLNKNFVDYKIPTADDIPERLESLIVEYPEETGPFGARGIGEPVMVPGAPAIANAVANALGHHFDHMPITPDDVLEVVRGKKSKSKAKR